MATAVNAESARGLGPAAPVERREGNSETINREVMRVRRLREDVLLLRYHLARRTDAARIIDASDRLASEVALAAGLEVLENADRNVLLPAGHIAAASAALLDAVDKLVTASRLAQEQDGTGDEPFPVTPESLRACLSPSDIGYALGLSPDEKAKQRLTGKAAKDFLLETFTWTVLWFLVALAVHGGAWLVLQGATTSPLGRWLPPSLSPVLMSVAIPLSGFFWALVGSMVWILIQFRRFGAAYAFDPAQADVLRARVLSGSVASAVLLYLVFGGKHPWVNTWTESLPVWGFALGYAGKLQVELLQKLVDYIGSVIANLPMGSGKGGPSRGGGTAGSAASAARAAAARSPLASLPQEPDVPPPDGESGKETAPKTAVPDPTRPASPTKG